MRFGLLGSLEVVADDGARLDLGGNQARTVLAMLLVASGRIVPVDSLIEGIWGDRVPASAAGTLQSYVSRLRRELEPGRAKGRDARVLVWEPPGYRLDVDPGAVDFRRFEELADDGRARLRAGDPVGARARLVESLALWRGDALLEFADLDFARGLATRLSELRIAAIEDRVSADVALGDDAAVIAELTELVGEHPLREQLWAQLATALYRSGRQADALRVLDDMRAHLRDELGVDPSPPLRELETRILQQDPSLAAPAPPVPSVASSASTTLGSPDTTGPFATGPLASGARPPAEPDDGLAGRAAEQGQLATAFAESARRVAFVVVEGEPGIGKTRLLEALAAHAAARGGVARWGRCDESGAAPAFWPWLEVLRALLAGGDATAGPELEQLLQPSGAAAPAADRFQLFAAVADAIETAAAARPLVILLDDVQWADPASLELLEFLGTRLDTPHVLLAAASRELEVGRDDRVVNALATLTRRPGTRRLHLHGLDARDTAVLVERATGARPSETVARAIHDRSDGNPFFAGELARLVAADAGAGDDELIRRAAVPAGVRDVVRRRLARLPEPTVSLLQAAAVLGRDTDLDVLARTADRSLTACLEDLEPALVDRLMGTDADAPGTVRFAHALVREVVLDDVSTLRRTDLHRRAADEIVAVAGANDDNAEIVASHLHAAVALVGNRRAAEALERAAGAAMGRYAYQATEELLTRALALRRASTDAQEDPAAELAAISRLAAAQRILHGYRGAAQMAPLARAREIAEQIDRLDILYDLLWLQWSSAATACHFDVSARIADELFVLGERSGNPAALAASYANRGVQHWHVGRITDATADLDEFARLNDRAEAGSGTAAVFVAEGALIEARVLGSGFWLLLHEMVGDIGDGAARLQEYAELQTDPYGATVMWTFDATAGELVDDPVRAARAGRKALERDPKGTFTFFGAAAAMHLGWALAELGEPEEGLALFDEFLPRYLALGVRTIVPVYLSARATASLRAERLDDALRYVAEAEAVLRDTQEHWTQPSVLMARGEIEHANRAAADTVAATLAEAAAVATAQGAHRLAARADALARRLGVTP